MTIQDFIDKLEKYPNKNSTINFKFNSIDKEDDVYDILAELELFDMNINEESVVDIMMFRLNSLPEADLNNNIRTFLFDMNIDKFSINIDIENGIYILDENSNVLREIEFKSGITKHRVEIIKKLLDIL